LSFSLDFNCMVLVSIHTSGSEIPAGGTDQNQDWCLGNPFYRFSEKNCEKAQKHQKGLSYTQNSKKSQFFQKFHPPPPTIATFFSDSLRVWKPKNPFADV